MTTLFHKDNFSAFYLDIDTNISETHNYLICHRYSLVFINKPCRMCASFHSAQFTKVAKTFAPNKACNMSLRERVLMYIFEFVGERKRVTVTRCVLTIQVCRPVSALYPLFVRMYVCLRTRTMWELHGHYENCVSYCVSNMRLQSVDLTIMIIILAFSGRFGWLTII